jgi:hypothetical protein
LLGVSKDCGGHRHGHGLAGGPLALGIFIFVVDGPYEPVLSYSTRGKIMLIGGLVLIVAGFL